MSKPEKFYDILRRVIFIHLFYWCIIIVQMVGIIMPCVDMYVHNLISLIPSTFSFPPLPWVDCTTTPISFLLLLLLLTLILLLLIIIVLISAIDSFAQALLHVACWYMDKASPGGCTLQHSPGLLPILVPFCYSVGPPSAMRSLRRLCMLQAGLPHSAGLLPRPMTALSSVSESEWHHLQCSCVPWGLLLSVG